MHFGYDFWIVAQIIKAENLPNKMRSSGGPGARAKTQSDFFTKKESRYFPFLPAQC